MASSPSNVIPRKTCCFETSNQSLKIQFNFSHRSDFCEELTWLKLSMMGKKLGIHIISFFFLRGENLFSGLEYKRFYNYLLWYLLPSFYILLRGEICFLLSFLGLPLAASYQHPGGRDSRKPAKYCNRSQPKNIAIDLNPSPDTAKDLNTRYCNRSHLKILQ